jgi:excinuclease ABC subunit A
VVRGRKGHYRELFEEIRKKGFVKARVDGEIVELRPKYQVDRYKIHDIEVVVDRMPVNAAMKSRLGESVSQCLKMGKDLLFVLEEGKTKAVQYSKQLMCETTGLSYEEPSPNSFSFNSPYGACPNCKGLGNVYAIDMSLLLHDHTLSINEGAIHPLGEAREASVFNQIKLFARKHKISLDKAINDLSKEQLNLILFGDKNISSTLDLDLNDENIPDTYTGSYEGIVPMMKRWFTSSQSTDHLKAWVEGYMELNTCPTCEGARLRKESLWFKVNEKNIAFLNEMHLDDLQEWFKKLPAKLDKKDTQIASGILKEIDDRISFLMNVGLSYLSLSRPSKSLSGGESQRIRLATQIGSQLQGITYILDEPSIGLHQRDNQRLITALKQLRDIGNTVLVVEHDKDIMMAADYLVDIGPKAGIHGGHIVAQGTPQEIIKLKSDTALYLAGKKKIEIPSERRKGNGQMISIKGATGNTLQKVNCDFPLGTFTVVTGVSGSGKSTLINETLYPILSQYCYNSKTKPMSYVKVAGLDNIDKVIEIDQSPIGRTPRSNPATYCGFFTDIRTLFASVPEAKIRGYQAGRFSFNVKSGRCEVCEGGGMRVIEMNFLPDVYVHCEKCGGKRYNRETLEIRYKGKSISDVLNMTVEEACEFFQAVPFIYRKLKVLLEVGLGYITLGQSAVTLSGGEAQRVKLATELGKKDTGKTFYILDEPTTGLHFQDIQLLIGVLNRLVDRGNTVLVIEHNMDVIKVADHIIDLGPEGGSGGGVIQFAGTPEEMIKKSKTHTAKYLALEMK